MRITFQPSSLLKEAVCKIRDRTTSAAEFRKSLRKIGSYMVYESSKTFETDEIPIETPLAKTVGDKTKHGIVILSVLRAALPKVEGVLFELEDASLGVVSASRGEMLDDEGKKFKINADYAKIPNVTDKIVILVDPMFATGSTIEHLLNYIGNEEPVKIVMFCAIASEYDISRIEKLFPKVDLYAAAVDPILNEKGYIVPGLGDAGDRAFNTPHL